MVPPAGASRYQINFNPNCTWREVVEVLVIAPAVPEVFVPEVEEVKVIRLGVLKFARFSRLKISARNWRESRSCNLVVLKAEKSHVARPGPVSVSRPRLPKKPLLAGGAMNALGLYHREGFPRTIGPLKSGLMKGRTGLRVSPLLEGL